MSAGAKSRTLILHVHPKLLKTLIQMSQLARNKLAVHASELLETVAADFRLRNISSNFLMNLNDKKPAPTIPEKKKCGCGRFSPEEREEIREQHAAGIKIAELAERWGCGAATIRRVLNGE